MVGARQALSDRPATNAVSCSRVNRTDRPIRNGVNLPLQTSWYSVVRPIPSRAAASSLVRRNGGSGARPRFDAALLGFDDGFAETLDDLRRRGFRTDVRVVMHL